MTGLYDVDHRPRETFVRAPQISRFADLGLPLIGARRTKRA
jgi:hypothetical protein